MLALAVALGAQTQAPDSLPVVEWAPDGKVLMGSNGLLVRFDLATGAEDLLDSFDDAFAVSPGGKSLALARGTVIELRSYPKLALEVQVWPPEGAVVSALAWTPDGKTLAAGTAEGRVLLWTLEPGELETDLPSALSSAVVRMKFSGDGKRLLVADAAGNALLWDVERKEQVHRFSLQPAVAAGRALQITVQDLNFSGRRVLVTRVGKDDSDIVLLDDKGEEIWRRGGYAMEFTRDGEGVLALGWPFRVAALYQTSTADALRTFEPPPEVAVLYFVRQSPDGKFLLGVGEDDRTQVLLLWEFETARLKAVHR